MYVDHEELLLHETREENLLLNVLPQAEASPGFLDLSWVLGMALRTSLNGEEIVSNARSFAKTQIAYFLGELERMHAEELNLWLCGEREGRPL